MKKELETLPSAYIEKQGDQPVSLEIELYDGNHGITLILIYSVFYDSNVITRSARLVNTSTGAYGWNAL